VNRFGVGFAVGDHARVGKHLVEAALDHGVEDLGAARAPVERRRTRLRRPRRVAGGEPRTALRLGDRAQPHAVGVDVAAADRDQRADVAALQLDLELRERQRPFARADDAPVERDLDLPAVRLDAKRRAPNRGRELGSERRRRDAVERSLEEWRGGAAGVQREIGRRHSSTRLRRQRDGLLEPLDRRRAGGLDRLLPGVAGPAHAQGDAGAREAPVGGVEIVRFDRERLGAAGAECRTGGACGGLGQAELELDLGHGRSGPEGVGPQRPTRPGCCLVPVLPRTRLAGFPMPAAPPRRQDRPERDRRRTMA
jgi:hypothetical protein